MLSNMHVLMQEHTPIIDGKTLKHQHPITYVSGLFQVCQHNFGCFDQKCLCNIYGI